MKKILLICFSALMAAGCHNPILFTNFIYFIRASSTAGTVDGNYKRFFNISTAHRIDISTDTLPNNQGTVKNTVAFLKDHKNYTGVRAPYMVGLWYYEDSRKTWIGEGLRREGSDDSTTNGTIGINASFNPLETDKTKENYYELIASADTTVRGIGPTNAGSILFFRQDTENAPLDIMLVRTNASSSNIIFTDSLDHFFRKETIGGGYLQDGFFHE